jgi:hypothetical protein
VKLLIIFLFSFPAVASDYCGKEYKDVYVDCRPRSHALTDKDRWLSEKEIGAICKLKIDNEERYGAQWACPPDFCGECMRITYTYHCHQTNLGNIVVEGFGDEYPSGYNIFKENPKQACKKQKSNK